MRLRSVSNRERSKYRFLPHGSFALSRVARALFRRLWSTAFTPTNSIDFTSIVPFSLHPAVTIARAARTETDQRELIARTSSTTQASWRVPFTRASLGLREAFRPSAPEVCRDRPQKGNR